MLDLAGVQALLDARRYKPGYTFRAYEGDTTRQIMIEIAAMVENSYSPGEQVALDIRWPVPPHALDDELSFDKALSWRLQQIEIHEAQEWYRKQGRDLPWVPVFNPHRDGADRDEWPIVRR